MAGKGRGGRRGSDAGDREGHGGSRDRKGQEHHYAGPHDEGLMSALASWRNAAMAAGLLMRQSRCPMASNHTKPSSPAARIPANRSAILAGWPAAGAAPVSAMS